MHLDILHIVLIGTILALLLHLGSASAGASMSEEQFIEALRVRFGDAFVAGYLGVNETGEG